MSQVSNSHKLEKKQHVSLQSRLYAPVALIFGLSFTNFSTFFILEKNYSVLLFFKLFLFVFITFNAISLKMHRLSRIKLFLSSQKVSQTLQHHIVKSEEPFSSYLKSIPWALAEFRHNKIVQTPHENYFSAYRQHKEKWGLMKTTVYVSSGRNRASIGPVYTNTFSYRFHRYRKHFFTFSPGIYTKTTENDNF